MHCTAQSLRCGDNHPLYDGGARSTLGLRHLPAVPAPHKGVFLVHRGNSEVHAQKQRYALTPYGAQHRDNATGKRP